ncbi:MAG: hypothetical protein A3H14_01685 [Candidatus Doudnabacteria bacterium RIFCSPLOWO2_12_FULL_49_8]|nr:MAG: hypothetical protein A3H14_01685 [Candidatus Doudnabacteria bacterium RIFCSPLOWO2_12_FULL_49_8]
MDMVDALQIKIAEAKKNLPEETRRAIDAVPWKTMLLGLKETKGYNFEQLGDLETETELLLCGLLSPEDYPKELSARMNIPRGKADELVEEMNKLVFSKIREELIKQSTKTVFTPPIKQLNKNEASVFHSAGIKILEVPELPKPAGGIITQKLSGDFHLPSQKTEYSVPNVTKDEEKPVPQKPTVDPYREAIE